MRRLALLSFAALSACGGSSSTLTPPPPPPPPAAVATVTVALSPATVAQGTSAQATATLRDAGGNTLAGRTVAWNTSNPAVATVNANGVITTVAVGNASISATSEGISGAAQLTVTQRPVAAVTVQLANASLVQGSQTIATAQTLDGSGNPLTGRQVSWSVGNPAVASVSTTGQVSAVSPGVTTVIATSEGITGSAQLTVTAPPVATVQLFGTQRIKVGDPYQYTAEARLGDGTLVQRPITWSVVETGRAVINASGLLVASATGSVTLQATVDGITASAVLTSYDWSIVNTGTSVGLVLEADVAVTNKFGTSAYPLLGIVCSNTGDFAVGIGVSNMVTASGAVSYFFDNGSIFSDFWVEGSSFDILIWPGVTNLSHKNFASLLALASRFGFAFNEFQAGAHATLFRTTGLATLLPAVINACPSNFLRVEGSAEPTREDLLRRIAGDIPAVRDLSIRAAQGPAATDGSRRALETVPVPSSRPLNQR